ncbi:MAG: hypothetical protein K8963_02760, partial [Proteobacteria bacterium]|nr:hypothetical protein [Pseudomonadota bacterium]
MPSNENEKEGGRHYLLKVSDADSNQRLDGFICRHLDSVSRATARKWIETGLVRVHKHDVY